MSLSRISQLISWLLISMPRLFSASSVCQRMENYTVTSMETYNEPVVVTTFTWCLQIPPRCLKTRSEMRQRYRVKVETKEKSVDECCKGYKELVGHNESDADIRCVPICENCLAGVCVSPNECQCDPGYRGDDCASACPPGTWGAQCKDSCDCGEDIPCNPVNGFCLCPPGYQGEKCGDICAEGKWGLGCIFRCECGESLKGCHHETGACSVDNASIEQSVSSDPENAIEETYQTQKEMIPIHTEESARETDIIQYTTQGCVFPCQNNESTDDCDSENGGCTNNDISVEQVASTYLRSTTENYLETWKVSDNKDSSTLPETTGHTMEGTEEQSDDKMNYPSATTNPATTSTTTPATTPTTSTNYRQIRTQANEEVTSTTDMPVIVVVSVPERRRNLDADRLKFMAKNPLLRHVEENEELRDRTAPKTDYVKTANKEEVQSSAIPLDVALIVVASIVSLGLTSMAVIMVLHLRSKLSETVRLSIYDDEKTKVQEHEGPSTGRITGIVPGGLRQPQTRLSPMYSPSSEANTILTVDSIEQLGVYANGAAAIGLRISGNLRDLLQDGHYDRPPATLIRLHGRDFEGNNVEHVYDEIPLQSSPICPGNPRD